MTSLAAKQVEDIKRVLRSNGIVYARMFGSAAVGALTFDSDIDLAVSGEGPLSSSEIGNLIDQISSVVLRSVDIVDFRTARGIVFDEALHGKEIFCDSSKAKAEAQYRRVSVIQDDIEFARASFNAAKDRMFRQ